MTPLLTLLLAADPGPPVPLWTRINPGGGGWFARVVAGPDGRVVAASDLGGAWLSRDDGQRWSVLGPRQGLLSTHVAGAAFHPDDPSAWLLTTDGGVYRTGDDGRSFVRVLDHGYVETAAWSPADPDRVWAAWHPWWDSPDGEVWRSDDGGWTWSPADPLPAGRRVLGLRPHPADPDAVWVITGEGRFAQGPRELLRSEDGGLSWVTLAAAVVDAAPELGQPDTLWVTVDDAAGDGHLLRSLDRGDHLTPVADRGGVIWPDPRAPGTVRLLDPRWSFPWDPREGLWTSPTPHLPASWRKLSGSATWETGWTTAFWAFTTEPFSVSADPDDPDRLLWATSQFIYGTADGGRSVDALYTDAVAPGRWRSRGVDNVVTVAVEASASELWAGFFDLGLWRSRDRGESWTPCNPANVTGGWSGAGGNTWTVLTDPARPGTVWATIGEGQDTPGFLLAARDSGPDCQAWWVVGTGLPGAPLLGLSLDPTSPPGQRRLYLTAEGDVWRSDDDGATFQRDLAHGGLHTTAVAADGTAWAGGEGGLWVRRPGRPWAQAGTPAMGGPVQALPSEWWKGVYDIEPDPHRPGALWVTVFGGGLWWSPEGRTWSRLLDDPLVRTVRVDPVEPDVLYLSASSAWASGGYDPDSTGVRRSLDGGLTWSSLAQGLGWPFGVPMAVSPDGRWLYLGVQGPGLHRRSLR